MNILLHDYSGHPFQVQMSRELARRGHKVTHVYFREFETPRGALVKTDADPKGFEVIGLSIGKPFQKATFIKRREQEIEYGRRLAELIGKVRPDVVVSANTPLDALREAVRGTRSVPGCAFVFWVQDLNGEAILRIMRKKLPVAGIIIGHYYRYIEAGLLRQSDHIISITEDFIPVLTGLGVPQEKIQVIENWAPLDEIKPMPKDNAWSRANGVADTLNIVYSGTLGYKHNPDLLVRLAQGTDANVMVFSEGKVAGYLAEKAKAEGLGNLVVRPWVDFSELPSVLASADLLVALIEPDAGVFSVPSKVLTYSCIGRPILGAMPKANLASRILARENAGLVSEPDDADAFVANARRLLADPALRQQMGRNARSYAERAFDIHSLADRFEDALARARKAKG